MPLLTLTMMLPLNLKQGRPGGLLPHGATFYTSFTICLPGYLCTCPVHRNIWNFISFFYVQIKKIWVTTSISKHLNWFSITQLLLLLTCYNFISCSSGLLCTCPIHRSLWDLFLVHCTDLLVLYWHGIDRIDWHGKKSVHKFFWECFFQTFFST